MRLRRPALAAALSLPLAASPGHAQAPPLVFETAVELVRLDVIVLDREGRPVSGLTKDDFTVEEDGREQAVETFEPVVVRSRPAPSAALPPRLSLGRIRAPGEGRSLLVFFDDGHVTAAAAENVRAALRRLVEEDLREGDWVTLLAPGQGLWWTARNAWEYRQLAAVTDRLRGQYVRDPARLGMSDWEAMRVVESGLPDLSGASAVVSGGGLPSGDASTPGRPSDAGTGGDARMGVGATDRSFVAEEVYSRARRRVEATLGSLRQALDSLVPLRGHKALVLVSEGFVLLPGMTGYAELVDVARRANVAVHLLDPRGLEAGWDTGAADASSRPWMADVAGAAGADDLAAATGGRGLLGSDAAEGLRRIAAESEAYYLLGYAPPRPGPGERRVRVRVRGEGRSVRARSRYHVADAAKSDPRRERARRRDDAAGRTPAERDAMRALADTTDLPLRLCALFFEDNGRGLVTTMYTTEIRLPVEAPGRRRFSTVAEARPRDGGKAMRDAFEQEVEVRPGVPTILSRHWHMPPGVWQVRVLVRETATGRIGTAIHTYEVPSPTAFRIASPILTTEMETVDGRDRPRVVLNRTFRAGQLLYVQYQVHGAREDRSERLPVVAAGWELRRGGEAVRAAEPTRIRPDWDGRLSRLLGVSLADLEPGDYELVIGVRDEAGGHSAEAREPFTVAP
jgi:VWFA-related protein